MHVITVRYNSEKKKKFMIQTHLCTLKWGEDRETWQELVDPKQS